MYKDSVIPVKDMSYSGMAAKCPMGVVAKTVLEQAMVEKRVSVGLVAALHYMASDGGEALFCFSRRATPGDSTSHMQEVLLQAFCRGNDICMVTVDSDEKIKKILGVQNSDVDVSCVLVHYPYKDPFVDRQVTDPSMLSKAEKDLIDCCKDTFELPLIKLPEK